MSPSFNLPRRTPVDCNQDGSITPPSQQFLPAAVSAAARSFRPIRLPILFGLTQAEQVISSSSVCSAGKRKPRRHLLLSSKRPILDILDQAIELIEDDDMEEDHMLESSMASHQQASSKMPKRTSSSTRMQ
jgi:hypothetical protein